MAHVFETLNLILYAPKSRGVYLLFDGHELIYIGRAAGEDVTIYSRLLSHLNGHEGRCTQKATDFAFEETEYPYTREEELLKAYKSQSGRLPRCNERIG